MPRSRSRSLESMARSATCWLSRKVPLCLSRQSTSVVLPWSTCAMMAMLRMSIKLVSEGGCWARLYARSVTAARRVEAASCRCHSPRDAQTLGHDRWPSHQHLAGGRLLGRAFGHRPAPRPVAQRPGGRDRPGRRRSGSGANLSSALRLYVLDELGKRNDQSSLKPLRAHECAEIGALGHRILPGLVLRPAIVGALAEFIDVALGLVGLHGLAALVVGRDLFPQPASRRSGRGGS